MAFLLLKLCFVGQHMLGNKFFQNGDILRPAAFGQIRNHSLIVLQFFRRNHKIVTLIWPIVVLLYYAAIRDIQFRNLLLQFIEQFHPCHDPQIAHQKRSNPAGHTAFCQKEKARDSY